MEVFSLASTLKMLRLALSSIVPNLMLLSKSAQLFHVSVALAVILKFKMAAINGIFQLGIHPENAENSFV